MKRMTSQGKISSQGHSQANLGHTRGRPWGTRRWFMIAVPPQSRVSTPQRRADQYTSSAQVHPGYTRGTPRALTGGP